MSSSVSSIHDTSRSSASPSPRCNKICEKFEYTRTTYNITLDIFPQKLTSPRTVSCLQHPPAPAPLRTPPGRPWRLCLRPSVRGHVSAPAMARLTFCSQIRSAWNQAKGQKQDGVWRGTAGFGSFIQCHMVLQESKSTTGREPCF